MKLPAFPFNSENLPIAATEIFVLLCLASGVGWLLARFIIKRRMHNLRKLIQEKKAELDDFRTVNHSPIEQLMATNASKTVYPDTSPDHAPDDLQTIEGIGPKIEELLNKEGIHTYEQLAETAVIRIAGILKKAGPRFQVHDPSSWPKQALLAKDHKWEELKQFKLQLISGIPT